MTQIVALTGLGVKSNDFDDENGLKNGFQGNFVSWSFFGYFLNDKL